MRSKNERALAKRISQKVISGTVKPVSVKKLQNGTLLFEVSKKIYADNLLKMNLFAGLKIKAYPHLSLNISNGVVRCAQLRAFPRGKKANSLKCSIFCPSLITGISVPCAGGNQGGSMACASHTV